MTSTPETHLFLDRERRKIQGLADDAMGYAKQKRFRRGVRPEQNIRLAMDQYAEFKNLSEEDKKLLIDQVKEELIRRRSYAEESRIRQEKEAEFQKTLHAKRAEELNLLTDVQEQMEKRKIERARLRDIVDMEAHPDQALQEQEELEEWRAQNRP